MAKECTIKNFYREQLELVASKSGLSDYQYEQVWLSKNYMDRNYPEKIELDEIASKACMSRFHYIRIFRQIYGVTPRHYLRDVRIEKAKQLLRQGWAVNSVCTAVGYESTATFSTTFKRGTGYSPTEYVQLNKSNRG